LSIFEIIKDSDKEEEGEKEHEYIMPKKTGEVDHIRGKGKEESSEKCLFFIDISYAVNTIYERNEQGSKEGREYP
jgi:hypothetical protein